MPATSFICPDGKSVSIQKCLNKCEQATRCIFLPTLRAVAKSLNRGLKEPTVTELIGGCRETFLKKTCEYAVDPQSVLYALHGSAVHTINEGHTDGNMLSEIRLNDEITSGKFDLYGQIMDEDDGVLGDIKVTSSYKIMKALGLYKVNVPTGRYYQSGARKGEEKYKKEWRNDGVKGILEWAIQLNYYRMLLEQHGLTVRKMVIQAMCRDSSLRIANERGIDQAVYLISINKISNHWIQRYMRKKAALLKTALVSEQMPQRCSKRERWNDRKCRDYCQVASCCPYGQMIKAEKEQPSYAS